jgi:hypothetical protein
MLLMSSTNIIESPHGGVRWCTRGIWRWWDGQLVLALASGCPAVLEDTSNCQRLDGQLGERRES